MFHEEGNGWRVAWDPSRLQFPVLLGGEGWAFELTDAEWKSLAKLILDLLDEHRQITSQLMEQESVSLEIEREFFWGCLQGDKDQWSLRLILTSESNHFRGVEAYWPNLIAKDFVNSMRKMWNSYS